MKRVRIINTNEGQYVRITGSPTAPVWIRGAFDKQTKTYQIHLLGDESKIKNLNPRQLVFIGFKVLVEE